MKTQEVEIKILKKQLQELEMKSDKLEKELNLFIVKEQKSD